MEWGVPMKNLGEHSTCYSGDCDVLDVPLSTSIQHARIAERLAFDTFELCYIGKFEGPLPPLVHFESCSLTP